MKRIIAFVFLGLVIYAGVFIMIYGIGEFGVDMNEPITLEMTLRDSMPIKGKIGEQFGLLGKKKSTPTLFGIPVGETAVTYFYVMPIGDSLDYMLIAVTDPEDKEAVENVSPGNEFSFTGIVRSMDPKTSEDLRFYLIDHPDLIGQETSFYILQTAAAAHVVNYVIYVQDLKDPDPAPIIAGAAMIFVGAGLAALLIVKIVRERTGY